MSEVKRIPVGRITKAHGIRGEVSVEYHADSSRLLEGTVYLQKGSAPPAPYTVAGIRRSRDALLARFAEIPDRTAAELLRGCTVFVPENRLPPPGEGDMYLHQVLGLAVIQVLPDGTEKKLGRVDGIASPAGQELWTVSLEGQEDILFPAVPQFVLSFDLDAGEVRVAPPPGLIELYRADAP